MKLEQAAREVVRQHSMECLSDKTVDALREALAEQKEQEHDGHWSDCSLHNEPAYPNGKCDCGGYPPKQAEQEPFKMICPRCKVDRVTTQCPNRGGIGDCPMTATAQSAAPVRTKDLTDDEIDEIFAEHGTIPNTKAVRSVIAADREKNK